MEKVIKQNIDVVYFYDYANQCWKIDLPKTKKNIKNQYWIKEQANERL